jgi:hypothetical protein
VSKVAIPSGTADRKPAHPPPLRAGAHALVAVVNSRCSRWSSLRRSARRVRIVLLAADGLSNTAFAERVGCRVRR